MCLFVGYLWLRFVLVLIVSIYVGLVVVRVGSFLVGLGLMVVGVVGYGFVLVACGLLCVGCLFGRFAVGLFIWCACYILFGVWCVCLVFVLSFGYLLLIL